MESKSPRADRRIKEAIDNGLLMENGEKRSHCGGLCLALKKVDTTVNKNEDRKEKEVQAGFHA